MESVSAENTTNVHWMRVEEDGDGPFRKYRAWCSCGLRGEWCVGATFAISELIEHREEEGLKI